MAGPSAKSDLAFRTIGELAAELEVPQHILRYWETRFPQLKPLQRAGNRRYYRPDDVALARRIHRLLNEDGYTIRGVQQLLAKSGGTGEVVAPPDIQPTRPPRPEPASTPSEGPAFPAEELRAIRRALVAALSEASGG